VTTPDPATAALPSGTVTFLFTDLEGSTRLWEEHPEAMKPALARHDAILRDGVTAHDGRVVKTTGDGLHAVFATARDALDAGVAMQRALAAEPWAETGPLRVRMGIHTCEAEYRDGDYYGSEVNRAARLMSVAHGGQVVVSSATAGLVRDGSVELVDLGEHRLRDLTTSERVFQVSAPALVAEFPPLRSLDAMPGNLPRQVTSFVGREAELASVAELVRDAPMVTLTGVGGVGKTRLALQVAAEVAGRFPDGAWLVELAAVADPDAVVDAVAASLRVQPFPGRTLEDSVLEYLATKRLLLVLDNCEHLLDAVAALVDAISRQCPQVTVLATSREGLALAGERIVAVPTLGLPTAGGGGDVWHADAVQLFADRAAAAQRDFVLTDANAETVAVLCRRLDGIPLAIELAAARVRSMAPEDLVARLDQRFKLLTRGSRAALERHQTLRSTIDWSYDLLDPTERSALQRLSVFAGGCDLDAAEAVLADDDLDAYDVDDVLAQLVDKSLVVVDRDDAGVRYRLLETIRQYAAERLQADGDPGAVRRRHAEHFIAVADAAGPHLRSWDLKVWGDRLAPDTDNLRAVLDWSIETGSADHALRLVAPLCVRGAAIGDLAMDWAVLACLIPDAAGHARFPEVAGWASWGATVAGEHERSAEWLAAADAAEAELGTHHPTVGLARACLVMLSSPEPDAAVRPTDDWVALARASGDPYELANALTLLGIMRTFRLDPEGDAAAVLDEAIRVGREAGAVAALSIALATRAQGLARTDGDRAIALLDEAAEVGLANDDRLGAANALGAKTMIAARRADFPTALRTAADVAQQWLDAGNLMSMNQATWGAAVALCGLGRFEAAAVLLGRGDAQLGRLVAGIDQDLLAVVDDALGAALGEEEVTTLAARGAAMEIPQAVALIRAEADELLA